MESAVEPRVESAAELATELATEQTKSGDAEQIKTEEQAAGEEDFPDLLRGLEKKLEGDAEAIGMASVDTASAPAKNTIKEE